MSNGKDDHPPALLAMEDGTVYRGLGFGAAGDGAGEIVFNTAITGYQEVLTDPSYRGQIVTMTAPEIGNVGVNPVDFESSRPWCAGFPAFAARRPRRRGHLRHRHARGHTAHPHVGRAARCDHA